MNCEENDHAFALTCRLTRCYDVDKLLFFFSPFDLEETPFKCQTTLTIKGHTLS